MRFLPLWLKLPDRDGINDRLNAARDPRGTEREEELPRLISHHLLGVDVLEYVDAVHRNEYLVDLK